MTNTTRTITIRYINGDEETFEFPGVLEDDPATMATHIQKLLDANQFIFDLGDRLIVIPHRNILNVEVSPVPSKTPPLTIHNARMILESKLLNKL